MNRNLFPPLPVFPARLPFRLGTTSFVYPAELLPNIQALAPHVDDIEIVLFESLNTSNFPSSEDIQKLKDIADAQALTYTVHVPIDQKLGSESRPEREATLEQIQRTIHLTRSLAPYAYLLHVEGIQRQADAARVQRWQEDVYPLLATLRSLVDDPELICIENLDYPFEWCQPFLDGLGFSVCLDAGHLWLQKCDWRTHVQRYRSHTRVIHLYGVQAGTEHVSLTVFPVRRVREFLSAIDGFPGVLTIETFGYDDTRSSMERLIECVTERTKPDA